MLFRAWPFHGNDALLLLLSLSPSLCAMLIRLLLLYVDRSDLWITEIEVGESVSECASTVVEWNYHASKICLLSSIVGTFGPRSSVLEKQRFPLSRMPPQCFLLEGDPKASRKSFYRIPVHAWLKA